MKRRTFLVGGTATLAAPALTAANRARAQERHPLWAVWEAWRGTHLDFSGRVVDVPQQNASHSEGQGYGMLLAAEMGDALAFERMAQWTSDNLGIRNDALLAWRWLPDRPDRVPDTNNASDGDLFHAWALLRAADIFGMPTYRDRAQAVATDLARLCLAPRPDAPGQTVLIPAVEGFGTPQGVVLNPSYMMPEALRAVSRGTGIGALSAAADTALSLMADLAAGGVTPDWVEMTQAGPRPAAGFSFDSGYEAVRVPLFLVWSGVVNHPALDRLPDHDADLPDGVAATVLQRANGAVLETSPDAGYRAVRALTRCGTGRTDYAAIPPFDSEQPYYPATLHIFSMLASYGSLPSCTPI